VVLGSLRSIIASRISERAENTTDRRIKIENNSPLRN